MAHDPEKDASAAELLPSSELLAFYKSRLDDFDKERSELLERIDRCAAQKAEIHSLEWENRKRAQEIQELQKALSDAHCYLFEERERLLQLQAENDELRLQEVEDRKRIQHLLSLTQPVEQEITYFREAKPDSVTVYPRENVPPRDNQAASSGKAGGSERVIRTIYLPSANADTLLLKVESLQSQLNEQRQLAAERLAALQEDRRIREQDEAAHQANYMKQVEQLTAKLRRCEDTLRQTTKDYILARREKQQAEQRAVTADAQLAQDRQKLTEQIQQLQRSSREQLSRNKEDSSKKMEEYIQTFRQQVKQREEEIANLESVHSTVKIQYERRISELEAKLTRMSEKCKQAEYRRSLEAEGFTNDVTLLRKQLAAVDRKLHQMRLVDRLQDDERLDALLSHLEKKAPSVSRGGPGGGGDDDASSLASETSAVAQDLRRIKGTILGLEERLRGPSRRRS